GGWLGDVSSGGHISPLMLLPRSRDQFTESLYQRYPLYSKVSLRELFNEEFLNKSFPDLRDAFLASFDPLEGETNVQLYEIWDVYERQARMTLSTASVDRHLFEHIRPFLDRDYLDFVMMLPFQLRFGQVLYQAMIYQLGPEIQDIPNSNTNLKLKSTVLGNILNKGIALGNTGKTRVLKRIAPSFHSKIERLAPDDIALSIRQDTKLRRIVEGFVRSPSFDSSIFNGAGILAMLDKHYRGIADYTHLLCTLATFAVGLSYFVYNKPIHCPPEAEPLN
ncbi:MAG: hypothetical protein ACE5JO_14345, partial [Candidatus Binatia bacterium]